MTEIKIVYYYSYLTEMAELVDYLAGIHQAAFLPNLIIVDGLQHYIQPVEVKYYIV